MAPRKLPRRIVVLILSAFVIVLTYLVSLEIQSKTFLGEDTEAEWTAVAKVRAQNDVSSSSKGSVDCRITKDPIMLLLDIPNVERNSGSALRYLKDCPHKCCFTMDWDGFIDTADLVGIVPHIFPFVPRDRYNQSVILQRQAANKNQVWLGVAMEPPESDNARGVETDRVLHWIGSYRKQADVLFPYGYFVTLEQSPMSVATDADVETWQYQNLFTKPVPPTPIIGSFEAQPKTKKLAAWLVSHCETRNYRELLVKSLQKYVEIDIYGDCGNQACSLFRNCHDDLAENYKFYLAFENSLCVDYVTEKLWSQLQRDIVPVTYAWINNTDVFPPNSYINALDFESVKDLADYLIYLDENEQEYRKYFQWKERYRVIEGGNGLCLTCEKLWELRRMRATAPSRGVQLKRHESMFSWMYSFPVKSDKGDVTYGTAEFKVGKDRITTNSTCIDPLGYDFFMNWIRDKG